MAKATHIEYERTKDLGNFQYERVKVVVQVLPDESAQSVLDLAKSFVKGNLDEAVGDEAYQRAMSIINNEDDCTVREVRWAKEYIEAKNANLNPAPSPL